MKNFRKWSLATAIASSVVIAGCGGSSSSDNDDSQNPSNPQTGVFLDSPVINIGYRTESLEGVTNSSGEYEYIEGQTVTFFIGDLELPPVIATGTVTPLDIAGSQDTSDSTVVNIIRLLQTLDDNGNPDDGITITDTAKNSASQVDFGLSKSDFEASSAVVNLVANAGSSNVELISSNDAVSHFEEQLTNNDLSFGELSGVWSLPSSSAIFMYFPDGRYFAIQWEEENDFIGFERGAYESSMSDLTISTLQNNDGEALFCNEPVGTTCSGEVFDLSISGDELTLDFPDFPALEFGREQFAIEPIHGVWEISTETGSAIFMYLPDGRYFAIQPEEENDFIGFERGTYQSSASEITFSTLQNNDGEALVCNEPAGTTCSGGAWGSSISNDELTLDVPDLGPVVFDRVF